MTRPTKMLLQSDEISRPHQESAADRRISSQTHAIVIALLAAAAASLPLVGSARLAQAQSEPVIPLQRDHRGEVSCPANYEIRGNACVSILAGRGVPGGFDRGYGSYRYRGDYFEPPRLPRRPHREHRDDIDHGRRPTAHPRLDYRGELVCPRNFVLNGNLCVSLW